MDTLNSIYEFLIETNSYVILSLVIASLIYITIKIFFTILLVFSMLIESYMPKTYNFFVEISDKIFDFLSTPKGMLLSMIILFQIIIWLICLMGNISIP